MDKTIEIAQAFAAIKATVTPKAIGESHTAGCAAAHEAMAANGAFFIMDENNFNQLQNAYAIGWNSTWGAAMAENDAEPAFHREPAWFLKLCAAVTDSSAPIVMIGAARSGKTRLATALQSAVVEKGVTITVIERQKAEGSIVAGAHLVVFRQSQIADAVIMSVVLQKKFTPDELLALPRWKAVIRLAGDSNSLLVDTSALYLNE